MMKLTTALFSFLLFTALPFLSYGEEELVVRLETESRLIPVALDSFEDNQSGLPSGYVNELKKIFRYDLDHNGMTAVAEEKEAPAVYRIEGEVKERRLSLKVSPQGNDEEFHIRDAYLSGYLEEDRKVIHKAADRIHLHLFGTEGIASTRFLYTVKYLEGGKEQSEIWESDYDGGNARQITFHSGYSVTPAYIPPRKGNASGSLVYVSYKTGQPKIYVASLQEGVGRLLLPISGNQLMPMISKQRDKIAFICDTTGNPDLFIQEFDPEKGAVGKPRHLYTAYHAVQGTPSFSPDGTKIAFVSNKSGTPRIYVMVIPPPETPLKNIVPQLISKFTKDNTAPSWSPDGTKIAYCSKVNGVRQIMVYDILTGLERQLTEGAGNKENPSWAPNSLHLVYNTSDSKACELYVLNLKQTRAVKVSAGSGEKRFPSWGG